MKVENNLNRNKNKIQKMKNEKSVRANITMSVETSQEPKVIGTVFAHQKTTELLREACTYEGDPEQFSPAEFIAKLYVYEMTLFRSKWAQLNYNTLLLEHAMSLFESKYILIIISDILDAIDVLGIETTLKDRAILHAIYNSDCIQNMDFYVNRGIQFGETFRYQIAEYWMLAEVEEEYREADKILSDAFAEGRDAFCSIPKRHCEFTEEFCKKAWREGYRYSELDCLINDALMKW